MTQWYVKDLSKLTNVSVQTLHHYDRIDLLKPSVRLANGYRVYSENEVLDDMYGDDPLRKKAVLVDVALQDDKISGEAKKWLQGLSKSL